MFRKSPRKDSSWRVYENPDAATYARPDPPQWARTRGERGQRRICGTRRRQSHTHFPGRAGRHRISPNGASHRQRSIAQHILMQARIICRQQHHGTRLISPAADFRHLHMDKKAGGKSANAKKSIHRKYASATGRFPSSQTSIPNEGRKFYPGSFYSAS